MSKFKFLKGIKSKTLEGQKIDRRFISKKKNINFAIIIVFAVFFGLAIIFSLFPIFSVRYKIAPSAFDSELEQKIIADMYKEDAGGKNLPFKNEDNEFKDIEELEKITREEIKKLQGDYGVYIKNMSDSSGIKINEENIFTAASLAKLFVAGSYYKKIEDNPFFDDDGAVVQNRDKVMGNGFVTESPVGAKHGYKDLVYSMLNQSDNTAFTMLTREIRMDYINDFIEENRFSKTDFKNNNSSPKDIGYFFERLYSPGFLQKESQDEMISFMTNTLYEDRIPFYLPSSVRVSHKIGTWEGAYSDAGIIYAPKGDYIMVVMTENSNYEEAVNFMRKLSEIVYNYFNSR